MVKILSQHKSLIAEAANTSVPGTIDTSQPAVTKAINGGSAAKNMRIALSSMVDTVGRRSSVNGEDLTKNDNQVFKGDAVTKDKTRKADVSPEEAKKNFEEGTVDEKYEGFEKVEKEVGSPALAAWIGRQKYGKKGEEASKSVHKEEDKKMHSESTETVVDILDEMVSEAAGMALFSPAHIDKLRSEYDKINSIDPAHPTYGKLTKFLDGLPDAHLKQLAGANVKWVSSLAKNRVIRKGLKESVTPFELFRNRVQDAIKVK